VKDKEYKQKIFSEKYPEKIIVEILKAYLIDGKSHRNIQKNILNMDAPSHGGGYEAMNILHEFEIKGEHKGILNQGLNNITKYNLPECINKAIKFIELDGKYFSEETLNKIKLNPISSKILIGPDEKQETYEKKEEINKIQEFEKSLPDSLDDPTKERVVKTRIGQGLFRVKLLKLENKCKICGLDNKELLIASHIKPWKDCITGEHLNKFNGFLLCPNHDALFDKGYISFNNEGMILLSSTLSENSVRLFNVFYDTKISVHSNSLEFLKWHRDNIFKN